METARVYKIKIRENILRQVIFTDRNIFIGIVIIVTAIVWKGLDVFPTDFKVFLSIAVSGIAILIFTIKIDRQSIIKIFPRFLLFWKRYKKTRY